MFLVGLHQARLARMGDRSRLMERKNQNMGTPVVIRPLGVPSAGRSVQPNAHRVEPCTKNGMPRRRTGRPINAFSSDHAALSPGCLPSAPSHSFPFPFPFPFPSRCLAPLSSPSSLRISKRTTLSRGTTCSSTRRILKGREGERERERERERELKRRQKAGVTVVAQKRTGQQGQKATPATS